MSDYFSYEKDKDKRRAAAVAHTQKMAESFADFIEAAAAKTTIYNGIVDIDRSVHPTWNDLPIISMQTMDSVSSIISQVTQNPNTKIAVLNFASYRHPGGNFIGGSMAQEESLCQASYLYNVLTKFDKGFYAWNREHLNSALYLNRGLYTPNVLFQFSGEVVHADVITVPAPNKGVAIQYGGVTEEDNTKALKSRINFVINIAEDQGVDILILGAFGCGVFKQNPAEVAQLFKERCSVPSFVSNYVFAVPPDGVNYPVFKRILS